jgi:hypothetical protein
MLPANAASTTKAFLDSVSCASAGNCAAVGTYVERAGHTQGLLLRESSGTWVRLVQASLPATAVGDYFNSTGAQLTLAERHHESDRSTLASPRHQRPPRSLRSGRP